MPQGQNARSLTVAIMLFVAILLPLGATSLVIGTGNVWITMGFGNNTDDGHSFSVSAHAAFDTGLSLLFDLDGYTDQRETAMRYSTLSLSLSYPFSFHPHPNLALTLSPLGGVHLSGDLGLQALQNLLHRILGRDEVFLTEAYDGVRAMVTLGANAQVSLTMGSHRLGARVAATTVPEWESRLDLSLLYQVEEMLTVGVGYLARFDHDHHPVRTLSVAQSQGLYLFSSYHSPLLNTAWAIWPETGFSWGSFGIDVLAFTQPKRLAKADLSTVSGIYYDRNGYQMRVSGLLYRGFLLQVHYSNGPTEKGAPLRRNIGAWSVGWQWEPFSASAFLRPSISLLPASSATTSSRSTDAHHRSHSACHRHRSRRGLDKKDAWIVGDSAYHFRLAVALHYTFESGSLVASDPQWERIARPLTLLFGLVLQIDHDLSTE